MVCSRTFTSIWDRSVAVVAIKAVAHKGSFVTLGITRVLVWSLSLIDVIASIWDVRIALVAPLATAEVPRI